MNKEFKVHLLNQEGIKKSGNIATIFDFALDKLKELCPQGREFSICITKLEEACFFAKKSMSSQIDNHFATASSGPKE